MKKAYLLLSGIILSFGVTRSHAQVDVNNPNATYPTMTAAFAAINAGTHTGDIVITITSSVDEGAAMATLNPSGVSGSNYTSIQIQPGAENIVVEGSGVAVMNIKGADNVNIFGDYLGSGVTDRDLTIRNNSIGGGNACIWISNGTLGGNNGAVSNIISNCIIEGVDKDETSYGVILSGSGTIGSLPISQNNYNQIINNLFRRSRVGVAVVGGSSTANQGLVVDNNILGSITAGEELGTRGISVVNVDGARLTNNTVLGVSADVAQVVTGIDLAQNIYNTVVAGNRIQNVSNLDMTGFGAVGIFVNPTIGGQSNVEIYNNEIHSISSYGHLAAPFTEDNGNYGIALLQQDGFDIYHNTIYMASSPTSGDGGAAAIYIGGAVGVNGVNLSNNVLINNTVDGTNYSVYCGLATILDTVNYNLYYSTGDLGYLGAITSTFADWKTVSLDDLGSVTGMPTMIASNSGVEVDINDDNCWLLNGRALALPNYGLDINSVARNTTPGFPNDMGSREFTPAVGVLPPVASADAAPSLGGITTYSVGGRKIARIQWGAAGTVPATVDLQYYSGIDPALLGYPSPSRIHSYYDIAETGGAGYTYTVEFYYTDAENRGISDGILQIVKDTTGAGDWGNKGGSATADIDGKFVDYSTSLSADGIFTLGNVPLGLDLLTFTAKNNNAVNDISWTTAAEKNMTHFDIERSNNGTDFIAIGSVKCNNDPIANSYKFRDISPEAGYNYYRLKMNEKDGRSTYSNIVAVKNGSVANVDITSVYPNPATTALSVALNSVVTGSVSVLVTDLTGKVLLQQQSALQEGVNEVSFNVSDLAPGIYMIKAGLPDGTSTTQKFVKQ